MSELFKIAPLAGILYEGQTTFVGVGGEDVDRSQLLTASRIGDCPRFIQKERELNKPRDDRDDGRRTYDEVVELVESGAELPYGYFERGHTMEEWYMTRLETGLPDNKELCMWGGEQITVVTAKGLYGGTPDGVLLHHDTEEIEIIEHKSTNSVVMEAERKHRLQLALNVAIIDVMVPVLIAKGHLPERAINYAIKGGTLVYQNASNWLDITSFHYPYDEQDASAMREDAKKIATAINAGKAPYTGTKTGQCRDCPFVSSCRRELRAAVTVDRDPQAMDWLESMDRRVSTAGFQDVRASSQEVKEAAELFLEAHILAKPAVEHLEACKKNLKSLMAPGETISVGGYEVKLSEVVQNRLDQTLAAKAGIDLGLFKRPADPFLRLDIKAEKV